MLIRLIAVFALFGLALPAVAAPATGDAPCTYPGIARAVHDLQLTFSVTGRVTEILVQEGQVITPGQVLIRLDERDTREQVDVLRLRAQSSIEIDSARAAFDLATNEEERVRDAHERGGANEFEVRRAELATLQAKLSLDLRVRQQSEAVSAYRRAELALEEYSCESPIGGVVEEILIANGEIAERLTAVVRVVQADPLRIEVSVDTGVTMGMRAGDAVRINADLAGYQGEFSGQIIRFAEVGDPASGTRLVIIEAQRPEQLPAGIRVMVEFETPEN